MLKIHLLGNTRFFAADGSSLKPDLRRKTRAVLAYLCLNDRPVSREQLAELFCQNSTDPAGNLRWHFSRIRRVLDDQILQTTDNRVQINRDFLWIDAQAFDDLLASPNGELDVDTMAQALALYEGELLRGLSLPDAMEFEFWLLGQRAHYDNLFESHATELIRQLIQQSHLQKALGWAQRLLKHNPTLEDVHYWLIWLYAQLGQPHVAQRQFETYEQLMATEFGAPAGDRILELRRQIEQNQLPVLAPAVPPAPVPAPVIPAPAMPFAGRQSELALLLESWRDAAAGRGKLLTLAGEPGMGKSALLEQILARREPAGRLFTSSCYESTAGSALLPWLKIIRSALQQVNSARLFALPRVIRRRLAILVPDLLPEEADSAATPEVDELTAQLLLSSIVDFFSLLGQHGPLLILIEEFHFADELSVQLLTLLLDRLADLPALVIVTQRPTEAHENRYLQRALQDWQGTARYGLIELAPLANAEIEALMAAIAPDLAELPDIAETIKQHAMGISLHIVELLHECQQNPALVASLPVPRSFARLVGERLARMTASQRQLLEALAVIEQPATLAELLACTGQGELQLIESLERATKERLVRPVRDEAHRHYGLSHYLFATVILAEMSELRQQLLHRRATLWYEERAVLVPAGKQVELVNRLLHHARRAHDGERLLRWVPIAAGHARDAFAYRQAFELYQHLDDVIQQGLPVSHDKQAELLLAMAALLRYLGDWQTQATILGRIQQLDAANRLENQALRIDFLTELGANQNRLGKFAAARRTLRVAIKAAMQSENEPLLAQAYNTLGTTAFFQSDWDTAEKNFRRCIEIRERLGDQLGAAKTYNNLGVIAYHRGDIAGAVENYRKNLTIREAHKDRYGMAVAFNNLGTIHMMQGELAEARAYFNQALNIRRELGDRHGTGSTLSNLAGIAIREDEMAEALQFYQESLVVREEIQDRLGQAHSLSGIAEIYVDLCEWDQAEEYLQRSLIINKELGAKVEVAKVMLSLGFAHAQRDNQLPREPFYEGWQLGMSLDSRYIQLLALKRYAWLLWLQGQYAEATRCLGVLLAEEESLRKDRVARNLHDNLAASLSETEFQAALAAGAAQEFNAFSQDILAPHISS
ncbi:MAG: tetratricopeptide repeat protein [Anaerolineales bacterium]|nr:tetratricopeptide repeat protein [Anaerolineales bacterium]